MDQQRLAESPDPRDPNPKERREKIIEFTKGSRDAQAEATKRILSVLTPEQRTKFEKLQGNKIDVTRLYDALIPGVETGTKRGHH
jgi:Spy/CpxP family protein refolding chaperone